MNAKNIFKKIKCFNLLSIISRLWFVIQLQKYLKIQFSVFDNVGGWKLREWVKLQDWNLEVATANHKSAAGLETNVNSNLWNCDASFIE